MNSNTDYGRFHTGRVSIISAGHAVHDVYTAFLAPLLPAFIERLALCKAEAGLLTVFLQAPSLLQPFIGHLADRVSLRYFVILAPAVTAMAMSFLGLAPNYAVLVLLLVVAGVSSASLHAVGPVMAGRVSGSSLGRAMGFWMVGGELGRTVGPIVIVSAIGLMTLKSTPFLMIGGLAASSVLYVRLKEVPGRAPDSEGGLPWRGALRTMRPLLLPLTGIIITRSFMTSALTTYLPIFMCEEGASLWFAGASLSVLEGAGMVGALLGGTVSDRLGRRWILFVSTLVTPCLMLAFLAADGWLRLPLLLLMGFAALSVSPAIMAMVQESFPENRALANGTYMSLSFGIRSVVVVVLGCLGDLFGLRLAFVASAVISFLGLPLIALLPSRRARSRD
ncbi:MAG: MFS transporter [Candidatus Eisenbacteria sp.]|nr:MFS transporter [Candidatus Eisenbacteria bacterium]